MLTASCIFILIQPPVNDQYFWSNILPRLCLGRYRSDAAEPVWIIPVIWIGSRSLVVPGFLLSRHLSLLALRSRPPVWERCFLGVQSFQSTGTRSRAASAPIGQRSLKGIEMEVPCTYDKKCWQRLQLNEAMFLGGATISVDGSLISVGRADRSISAVKGIEIQVPCTYDKKC